MILNILWFKNNVPSR